jgi:hypothetical protein
MSEQYRTPDSIQGKLLTALSWEGERKTEMAGGAPVSVGASPIGTDVGGRSILRAADPRSLTLVMVVMPVVITVVPVRIRVPVPRWGPIPGGIVVRLTIPVPIAVKSPPAAGHLDNVRHCRGAGVRSGGTGVRGHRSGAQDHRTKQGQNCCTHRGRPSTPLRHGPGKVPWCRRGEAIRPMYRRYVMRRLAWCLRCRTGVMRVVG